MMDRFLRLASIVLVAAGVAACDDDDTATPQGETSTVTVNVFIADSTSSDGDGDDPIAGATVTLTPTDEGEETLSTTTDANGVATFNDVPAGVYTLTHEPADAIDNAVLTGPEERTLVAQFEGGTTTANFVYSYNPGSISVQFFRDENDNDTYEEADDTTLAGFQAILFEDDDTTGTAIETITVDSTGVALFENVAQGDYTILIRPIVGAEVSDSTIAVIVVANQQTDVLVEFTGGEAIATIAAARQLPNQTPVTVEGVVTAGTGVFSSTTFYIQDPTAGIVVFVGNGGPSVDVAVGDSVRVSGVTGVNAQEIQISGGAAMDVEILGTGAIPAPETVTSTDVLAGEFQGELVVANALTIDSVGAPFSGGNFNVRVSDADSTFIVFFDADVGIVPDQVIVGETYNITGIMTRFNATLEIKPRSQADVVLTSNPGGLTDIGLARLLENGETTTVRGVVTAGTGTYSSSTFYVQDETGGITVFTGGTGGPGGTYAVGDSVEITGVLGTFSAERQIAGGASLTITDLGTGAVPTAAGIDAADVNAGKFQGELAAADSVRVTAVSVSGSGNLTVTVEDNAGEFVIFGDVDTGLTAANFVVGNSYAVTGVLASFQSGSNPPLYQLKPRSAADVTAL